MNYIDQHIDEIRSEFKLLDYWVYLNAGDQMIPGNYWLKAVKDFYNFVEFGRMEDIPNADIATHPFLTTKWGESIELGAKFINAEVEEVTNTYRPAVTANLILYNMFKWNKGDNVVITNLSYPSIPYILSDISKKYGVEIRVVKHVNGEILMEDLEKQIDDNTRLLCIDRTTAFCGFTFDMKEVCAMAHKHGALVLDDAIQAFGAIDIDVRHDDLDFLVTGAYKWQCGPEGAGLLFVRKELVESIDPDYRNYIWSDFEGPIPFGDKNHETLASWQNPPVNTANKFSQDSTLGPALFGWVETLRFYNKIGIKNVEERIKRLGGYAIERLEEIGCHVYTPKDPAKRHGLITYTTGDYEADKAFFNRCASPGRNMKPIKISLRALGGVGNIRVCTHFFNTEEDIDYLVALQKSMMPKK
ncbi:MAG: aminotransferase class V-fold PLP-dependent enzyme [Sphaerochaetaceae bacterium]|jgi:cysteine desulfurase/selenocysteine lyase